MNALIYQISNEISRFRFERLYRLCPYLANMGSMYNVVGVGGGGALALRPKQRDAKLSMN